MRTHLLLLTYMCWWKDERSTGAKRARLVLDPNEITDQLSESTIVKRL